MLMIEQPNAGTHPWAVVVHAENTTSAKTAMMGSRRLNVIAFFAKLKPVAAFNTVGIYHKIVKFWHLDSQNWLWLFLKVLLGI